MEGKDGFKNNLGFLWEVNKIVMRAETVINMICCIYILVFLDSTKKICELNIQPILNIVNLLKDIQPIVSFYNNSTPIYLFWKSLYSIHKKELNNKALNYWISFNSTIAITKAFQEVSFEKLQLVENELNNINVSCQTFFGLEEIGLTSLLLNVEIENTLRKYCKFITIYVSETTKIQYSTWIWIALVFVDIHGMVNLSIEIQNALIKIGFCGLFSPIWFSIIGLLRYKLVHSIFIYLMNYTYDICEIPESYILPQPLTNQYEFFYTGLNSYPSFSKYSKSIDKSFMRMFCCEYTISSSKYKEGYVDEETKSRK